MEDPFGERSQFKKNTTYYLTNTDRKRKHNFYTKRKKNVDRHGPRPLPNNRYLSDPPCLSLYTTFNGSVKRWKSFRMDLKIICWTPPHVSFFIFFETEHAFSRPSYRKYFPVQVYLFVKHPVCVAELKLRSCKEQSNTQHIFLNRGWWVGAKAPLYSTV